MVNMNTVSGALQNFYIKPLCDEVNMRADAFVSQIKQTDKHIVGYHKIVRAAIMGANGGAGAGSESGVLPTAGENQYVNLENDTKNLYGSIEISDKIIRAGGDGDEGAFGNVLQLEMDNLIRTLKWNLGRQIYGDGSGKLAVLTPTSSSAVVTAAVTTQYVLPGLKVDLFTASGNTIARNLRVLGVDHLNKTIRLSASVTCPEGAYLTIQGSANYELTGLGKLFDGGEDELYGLKRSDYSWMNPTIKDDFGAISTTGLQTIINGLEDGFDAINLINCGNEAYNHFLTLVDQRRAICGVTELPGGHRALTFNGIPLTRSKFMPAASIDLYNTDLFALDQISDWQWMEDGAHAVLRQKPGYPVYTATVAKYCDLMCVTPGGIARLNGVAAPQA